MAWLGPARCFQHPSDRLTQVEPLSNHYGGWRLFFAIIPLTYDMDRGQYRRHAISCNVGQDSWGGVGIPALHHRLDRHWHYNHIGRSICLPLRIAAPDMASTNAMARAFDYRSAGNHPFHIITLCQCPEDRTRAQDRDLEHRHS